MSFRASSVPQLNVWSISVERGIGQEDTNSSRAGSASAGHRLLPTSLLGPSSVLPSLGTRLGVSGSTVSGVPEQTASNGDVVVSIDWLTAAP